MPVLCKAMGKRLRSLQHMHWEEKVNGVLDVQMLPSNELELAASFGFRNEMKRGIALQRFASKPHALFLKKMYAIVRRNYDPSIERGARRIQGLRDVHGWSRLV